ncbi:MAG: class I SAM-dependent rRNA methyltransferase, partial [Thermodesulfobacteriota bacterium]
MTAIVLKKERESSLKRLHPWIFSGAVADIPASLEMGQTVEVLSHDRRLLARGAVSPRSQIAVRVWTFDPDQPVDEAFFLARLTRAVDKRTALMKSWPTTALRLVNAESDGLPGLIVDRYGDFLVIQFLSAGAERWKKTIVEQLSRLVACRGIFERSDASVRDKEGLRPQKGVLWGEHPPELVEIRESELGFLVDVVNGHKTGFYLDQRENRRALESCAKDADVLNCFAYTGGFGLYALKGGARHVTNVETSGTATA